MPTIKDVAREAGVSIATVSYVLNNKAENVSESTFRHVLAAAERIGYRPNVTAQNLRSSQTRLIGYAWYEKPSHGAPQGRLNTLLDLFIYYLASAAEQAGYHLLTFTYPPHNPTPVYDELIRTGRVDAFVLAGTTANDERVQYLLKREFPFVSFGRSNDDWSFPWVDTDNRAGMYEAVRYLIGLGHRRIALLGWPEHSLTGNYRLEGYAQALNEVGLTSRPEYIFRGEHNEQTGRAALTHWLQLPQDIQPTAVVAVSDLMAIGVMNEAQQRGLEIGRDLSVIGFDDVPMTEYLRPALTTIQQPIPQVGEALISMLESLLSKHPLECRSLLIPPRLIIRDSCAPPLR
jgi:DNA-binding LacI/PurR family transcriptional regulator